VGRLAILRRRDGNRQDTPHGTDQRGMRRFQSDFTHGRVRRPSLSAGRGSQLGQRPLFTLKLTRSALGQRCYQAHGVKMSRRSASPSHRNVTVLQGGSLSPSRRKGHGVGSSPVRFPRGCTNVAQFREHPVSNTPFLLY